MVPDSVFCIVRWLGEKLTAEIWQTDNEEQPKQLTTSSSKHLV